MFKKAILAAAAGSTLIAGAVAAQTATTTTTSTYSVDNSDQVEDNARSGLVAGATAGAIAGGPVGAIVGGAIGATAGNQLTPDTKTVTYVQQNPVRVVPMQGDVVAGYVVPDTVTLTPVPESQFAYVYTDQAPVIVDPQTREVITIVR